MQLIPLELVKSNHDSVRKARDAYLFERGQTLETHGFSLPPPQAKPDSQTSEVVHGLFASPLSLSEATTGFSYIFSQRGLGVSKMTRAEAGSE